MSRRTSHHVATSGADRDLSICLECSSELVKPMEWEAAGSGRWRVALLCPNCHHTSEDVFSQECVDRFDERLDAGTAAIVCDLKRLEQAVMAEEVERFIGAIQAGAILPEDFAIAEVVR